MNVLWLSGQFRAGESGVMAAPIARIWADAGHHLTYWPFGDERPWSPAAFHEVVDPDPLPRHAWGRLLLLGKMRRAFRDHDVVVVEQDLALDFLAAEVLEGLPAPGQGGGPAVWLLTHQALGHYLAARGEHLSQRPRRMAQVLYPRFHRIITLIQNSAIDLHRRFGVPEDRVMTLPWPALRPTETPRFAPARVVVVGEADGLKGVELLIQAMASLQQEGVAAEVALFGDGPRLPALRALAESLSVPFLVFPLTPESAGRLTGSVFHAPQWLDGSGWQLVQAAAVGLPLTAVNAPDAATEITRHGALGKLTALGSLDELTAALRPLLTQEAAWKGYHEGALALARHHQGVPLEERWAALASGSMSNLGETP